MVITGDLSQIDLPDAQPSGLAAADHGRLRLCRLLPDRRRQSDPGAGVAGRGADPAFDPVGNGARRGRQPAFHAAGPA